jgi:DNA replication and repair protein RecF
MYIQRLFINDYRNIENVVIDPDPEFNVLWGNNAQGKTNFLEGIYLLGNLRSFRSARNEELIRHHKSGSRLIGNLICQGIQRRIELTINTAGKSAKVDGKEIKKTSLFMGYLRPVLFSPEEVGLIKGYPSGRRSLLDRAVYQADPSFLERAQQYERILRQRNQLLREGKDETEIAPWTEHLINAGARIRFDRQCFLGRLLPLLRETYRNITDGHEEADLFYSTSADDEEELRRFLRRELAKQRQRERDIGQTLAGPHRDDPLFMVEGRPLRVFGSQGQHRSYMLAFKTAQIMDLEKQIGESPVLLLDDMTGELDRQRQEFFFRFLLERRGKVFFTNTDIMALQKEGFQHARFFRVSQGTIQEDS